MNWYLIKIVYQIICGDGNHTAQFDEQLRLITAGDEEEALDKATAIGYQEEESFCNDKQQLVQWRFVNITELYPVSKWVDGAEVHSQIREAEDGDAYSNFVHHKAFQLRKKNSLHSFL
ncbi:MAG: DUF4288 domain-containing protein [Bacteroidota bacterium]|nr:DUF4288 domain-containing protein [Bacteroidota bacterium]